MSWREHAACLGADLNLFMPTDTHDPLPVVTDTAQRFCRGCPSQVPCGAEADAHRDLGLRGGVWRSGGSAKYRRYPLLGEELGPLPYRAPGVRVDRWAS